MKRRPKALDLFCKAGGASMGLERAGFQVTGVDIEPQPRYPFRFIQADALELSLEFLRGFDFIWASPPCEGSSVASIVHRNRGVIYPQLIPQTRTLLRMAERPYCIENVVGAPLQPFVIRLCGLLFHLPIFRHRVFESSFFMFQPPHPSHAGKRIGEGMYSIAGGSGRWKSWGRLERGVSKGSIAEWRQAMGIPWMQRAEIVKAIPPAYSEFIGRQALTHLKVCA